MKAVKKAIKKKTNHKTKNQPNKTKNLKTKWKQKPLKQQQPPKNPSKLTQQHNTKQILELERHHSFKGLYNHEHISVILRTRVKGREKKVSQTGRQAGCDAACL